MSPARNTMTGIALTLLGMSAAVSATAQQVAEADVLSIGGSVTEIVVALGQQHRLKARDTTSSFPPDVTALPDVGYMRALSPEGVLSVGPSLILSEEGAGPPEALDVIRDADIAFVEVGREGPVIAVLCREREVGGGVAGLDECVAG